MLKHRWTKYATIAVVAVVLALCVPSSAVIAQGTDDGGAAAGQATESFAGYFLWSTNTDAAGNKSMEVFGTLQIWFLILLDIVSIGLIIWLAWANQRRDVLPQGVLEQARKLIGEGKYRAALDMTEKEQSFFSRVLHAALAEANHGYAAMIRQLEQSADEFTTIRLRRVEVLNVMGQVAPMIGLFGTVYGMIRAFMTIAASGGDANPVQLAGGIGTALVTTFWGLVVAIPALAAYAIIRNRIDELTTEATLAAERLVNQFRPGKSAQKGGAPSA
jgi:biopolymer transport protein ExbB